VVSLPWRRHVGEATGSERCPARTGACLARRTLAAYTSSETGSFQIYVTPFPGPGAATQISVDGGLGAVWTRDGRRLLYQVGGRFVISATLKTSPGFAVTARDTIFRGNFTPFRPHADYDVSPDGSQLLLVNPSASGQWLVVLNWVAELRAKLGAR
jgi:hypothetical protein